MLMENSRAGQTPRSFNRHLFSAAALLAGMSHSKLSFGATVNPTYRWSYAFPNAAAVDPAKVRIWIIGSPAPARYNTGDILLAVGPNGALTGDDYGPPFDLKGPLVLCGLTLHPTPRLIGSPFSARNPYKGINNIFDFKFAATATSHAPWRHEPNQAEVNWPFVFFCNSRIDFQAQRCNFGDIMRVGIRDARSNDPRTKAMRGPKCAVFWNKIRLEHGPHYSDDYYTSNGQLIGANRFHSDGIQNMGGVACWRVADTYMNWIMGQAFFCGVDPETYGFPRTTRHKFRNVAWEHVAPWNANLPSDYNPATGSEGTLWASPRMVMNYESGFNGSPFELSDYSTGKYWATIFEGQCYIKRNSNFSTTNVDRYLACADGINGRDTNGNYKFSTAVKPTHTFPAWAGNIRLLQRSQILPQVVDPAHTGSPLRITSVGQFMSILFSNGGSTLTT
jgi:hypothetical protein